MLPVRESQSDRVGRYLERHKKLKADKEPWNITYQLIGEFVHSLKQDFTSIHSPGQFMTGQIFDSTACQANMIMGSALLGALYPNGAKSFSIVMPNWEAEERGDIKEVRDYFAEITRRVRTAMDKPEAGLPIALQQYMDDQGSFGISGIMVDENYDDDEMPIRFTPFDCKQMCIAENQYGFVDTVYLEKEMTYRQLALEFGEENISTKAKEALKAKSEDDKVKVLHILEPRKNRDVTSNMNDQMPIACVYIEVDSRHLLREEGYQEMPLFVTRFKKMMSEVYGRSPAMDAMPDIIEVNTKREAYTIAVEKMLDPPLAVTEDGAAGGGSIDTSAGAINVRHVSGRIADAGKWIEPILTVGELQSTDAAIERLQKSIKSTFYVDLLLDLNNETRMTLGEANIRNDLRGQALGSVFVRQIAELFQPMIQRVFKIMLGRRLLGVAADEAAQMEIETGIRPLVIPDVVLQRMMSGKNAFDVEWISPAARIMKSEELKGIQLTVNFVATELAAIIPDAIDVLDGDEIVRKLSELTGAPSSIIKGSDIVDKLRQARAAQQAAMMKLQENQETSKTAKAAAQAAEHAVKAGVNPMQLLQGLGGNGQAQPA